MRKKRIAVITLFLVGAIALFVGARLLAAPHIGQRRQIPARNVGTDLGGFDAPTQRNVAPHQLYLYLREEDGFPLFFTMLERWHLRPPRNPYFVSPTEYWQVLNMDVVTYRSVVRQTGLKNIQIEIVSPDCGLIVDSRIPRWLLLSKPRTPDTGPLPFDVRQRYPEYFAETSTPSQ